MQLGQSGDGAGDDGAQDLVGQGLDQVLGSSALEERLDRPGQAQPFRMGLGRDQGRVLALLREGQFMRVLDTVTNHGAEVARKPSWTGACGEYTSSVD